MMLSALPRLNVEVEQEVDGRWLAEVMNVPGAMAYGSSPEEATDRAKAIARDALSYN